MLAFWIQYRNVIMRTLYAAVLGVCIWGVYLFMEQRKKEGSEQALASAASVDDLRKVTTEWAGTAAAATAQFRIADELRTAGKFDEAATEYGNFAQKNPTLPLLAASVAAQGITLEKAGKQDEALATYKRLQTNYPKSGHVSVATLGIARILAAKGNRDEAIAALDSLLQGSHPFSQDAIGRAARDLQDDLKNPNARKTGGTPRPAPAPAPAPTPGAPNNRPSPLLPVPPGATPPVPAPAPAPEAAKPATPAPAPAPEAAKPATPAPAPAPEAAKPATPAPAPAPEPPK